MPGRGRLAVAVAAAVMLGGTGFAAAGALPGPVQGVVDDTLARAGVGATQGPERYKGPECDASRGDYKNHGQYVKLHGDDRAVAARSRCGKPIQAGRPADRSTGDETKPETGPCQGPPPWAGKGAGQDKAAKAAQQAERRARCGEEDEESKPAAPTTIPPTTTTVLATTTTVSSPTTTTTTTTTQP